MKGDYDKRLMLDAKEAKTRKHAAYWGGIGSWRLKGNTYQYWSLKWLVLFLFITLVVVYVVLKCEATLVGLCNKIISIGGAHG